MGDSRSEPAWAWPNLHDAQRDVLLEVLINGSASRAELARRTGLSRTSLTRLARDLVELGFLTEGETNAPNGRGRPSEILNLEPSAARFAGVKLTGEAVYAVVTDLQANVIELEEQSTELEAIVVTATRGERRVEDTPLRVEVIDEEEIAEKVAMTPGDIAMMLNETSGLRV